MPLARGFTLVEVLVSLLIVGAIAVVAGSLLQGIAHAHQAAFQSQARSIAEHELESARALGPETLPPSVPISNTYLAALPQGTAMLTTAPYRDGVTQVTVTVSWKDPRAATSSQLVLSTLVATAGGLIP